MKKQILVDDLEQLETREYTKMTPILVPENWEDLQELCKDIKVDLKLTRDGKIYCYEHLIAENRTPQQMWQIIKNLIGE